MSAEPIKEIPIVRSYGELLVHQLFQTICHISESGLTKPEQLLVEKYAKIYEGGFEGDFVAPFLRRISAEFSRELVRKRQAEDLAKAGEE